MKKITIFLVVVFISLITINFSLLYIHKKSIVITMDKVKNFLEYFDYNMTYSKPSVTNYLAWHPSFNIDKIKITSGNKMKKKFYEIQNVKFNMMTMDKLIDIIFADDPVLTIKSEYMEQKKFILKQNAPSTIQISLNSSTDEFLRNETGKWLSKIRSFDFSNTGYTIFEKMSDGSTVKVSESKPNVFTIHQSEIDGQVRNKLHLLVNGITYDPLYKDPDTHIVSKLGTVKAELEVDYFQSVDEIGAPVENFQLGNCYSHSDIFSWSASGSLAMKKDVSGALSINLDSHYNVYKYRKSLELYQEMLNNAARQSMLENQNDIAQMLLISDNKLERFIKLLESLPEVTIEGDNMHFSITQKPGTEIQIAGRALSKIKDDMYDIFIPHNMRPGH